MRRLSIKKILGFILVMSNLFLMSGCSIFEVDRNESKYMTVPYDVCPLEGFGSD